MKKCMKSLLSVLLCAVMLLGVVPISALAAPQTPVAIGSNIVATKAVSLVVPFTSTGAANSTAKVIKEAGECVWVFRVDSGSTLAYCVEPGAELGDLSTIDSAKANKYWTELKNSPSTTHKNIVTGVHRAAAIADYLNYTNDSDVQAIHNIVIWEIICGLRDPLTGDLISGKTSLQNSFYNAATPDQANLYTARYTAFVNALKSFGDIPSVLYSTAASATANPITLNWNATNHRFQATVTDTTGLLSSMKLPSTITSGGKTVHVSRSGNNLTLWSEAPLSGTVTSSRINKNYGFNTSTTQSMLVYGGTLGDGETIAQCVVSSARPDPASGYLAVKTGTAPTIDIPVKKVWEKTTELPSGVYVRLYKNGSLSGIKILSADNNWQDTFENMAQIDSNGDNITYTVDESPVDGYTTTITGNATSGFVVTNTKITTGTTTISGTKTWVDDNNRDGVRPAQIFVNLYRDGVYYDQATASEETDWTYSFADVPIYNDDGSEIKWTIEEVEVPGYDTSYNGYDIVNSHTSALMTLTEVKEWDDDNDRDGIRPDSITIRLYADGVEISHKEVTEADNWSYEWTELPKYRDGGIEIVYEIKEDPIEGYDTYYDGWNVINTHEPERITVSGIKTWNDKNNQDGYRPEKITVRLYADGTEINSVIRIMFLILMRS